MTESRYDLPLGHQTDLPLDPQAARQEHPDPPGEEPTGHSLISRRLAGGVLDLVAHLAALAAAVVGGWLLGVPPTSLSVYPLALFVLSFSFLFHVLPLTFWGHTPGMASVGLLARSADGGPLTINQSIRRWLGVLLIAGSCGLLFLIRPKGQSIPDLFSGSTVRS